jgi:hypothetical protein
MDALQRFAARLQARDTAAQDPEAQAALAAPEHQAFVRAATADNPLVGGAVALASLPYALGKEAYFNPSVRSAINTVLPEQAATPMWKFLEKQVGQSRSQNKDPWGQIGGAFKGFGQGLNELITRGKQG